MQIGLSYRVFENSTVEDYYMLEKFSGLKRPPLLVYALGPGESAPRASALQLPVFPHFETDAELQRALLKSARFAKLPLASRNRYLRVCDALSAAQLGSHSLKSGRHYYISFQRRKGTVRWTIYLSPQFYQEQFGRVGLDPEQPWWEQPKGDSETQS